MKSGCQVIGLSGRHVRRSAARLVIGLLSAVSVPLTGQARPAQPGRTVQAKSERASPAAQGATKATRVTTVEGITEYSLPNGLRVLLFPDQSKPTVTVNITYLVGSRHEGYGEAGMAHLLEHLAFKGSTGHPKASQELSDHGARFNGTTFYDRTNYYETVPSTDKNLEWALDLEADRMVNSFIAKKDLESEFSVVRNEFELGENNPFRVTFERVMSAAYRFHGYGRSTIGNKADIESVPIDRLQAFYRKYYQPDNAILVVAGKFDAEKTLGIIETRFGRIPRPKRTLEAGNVIYATYTTEPVQDGERFVTIRRVGDTQQLMAGYHVPAGAHPDFAAVQVLTGILTDNPSGRLYKALVDAKLAASVNGFTLPFREPGMVLTFAEVRKENSLDSARAVLERTLDSSRTYTTEEVERAKTDITKDIDLALNNSEQIAIGLTEWAAAGDWRLFFLTRDRVKAVTPADVQRVAGAYLKPSNRTVAVFIPTTGPDRAEVPATPNIAGMVANYRGTVAVQAGEAFDASPRNIDARTTHKALANGLQLTLLPKSTRGNRVITQIALRHGTEATLTGKVTISQLTTAMLSRGTTTLTRQQVKDSLDKLKAQVNILGGGNNVVANIETVRDNVLPALELVVQELRTPRFDASEFDKLKQENLAQIEQAKSEPIFLAQTTLFRALSPKPKGSPLYVPTADETIADLNAATLDEVKAFHTEFYGASFGDVAVIGDFDLGAITAAITRLLGDWKSPQPFARIVRTVPQLDSSSRVIETPDKANAAFFAGQNLTLRDDDADFAAMTLANYLIGGGALSSRLVTRLRQKEGISYAAQSVLQAQSLDRFSLFATFAIYAPQNVDRVLNAMREEMDRVRTEGFTQQEVDAAKSGYLQLRSQGRANDNELVGTLVNRRFAGRTMAYDDDLEKRIQALTPADVNAAAKKYLDPSKVVSVRAGDFAKHPPVKATP
ncbi:MAG TPA: pitrilysin family protein [Gemmatimonadaceae bacterium]|nr:pitrilysin family protein [Gemmatimonadaceae bacterium]